MFPEEADKYERAAEGHDGEGKRKVNQRETIEADSEKDHGDNHEEAGHFHPDKTPLRRTTQAHSGTGNEGAGDGDASVKPKIHGCVFPGTRGWRVGSEVTSAPSRLVIMGTLLRRIW